MTRIQNCHMFYLLNVLPLIYQQSFLKTIKNVISSNQLMLVIKYIGI